MNVSGIPVTNNVFAMSVFMEMNNPGLVGWLLYAATLQEQHPFHGKNTPEWVAGPSQFRQHAVALTEKDEAAKNKDTEAAKLRDLERAATLESIHSNASYIVMRARYHNDESLFHNTGYDFREKTKRNHAPVSVSDQPPKMIAKRADEEASVVLIIEKDPGAALYEVQICKGTPTGEDSWQKLGTYKKLRIYVPNLERAGWYYFRVRSYGDNETSPWSQPCDIIVG